MFQERNSATILGVTNTGVNIQVFDNNATISGFIPSEKLIKRENIELKPNEKVIVVSIDCENKNNTTLFQEVFDYEIGEKLKLTFLYEVRKKCSGIRCLVDNKFRLIYTRTKDWQKGPKYNPPQKNTIIEYIVLALTENFYPIIEEIETKHPFSKDEFKIGQEIELFYFEDYEKISDDTIVGHRVLYDKYGRKYDTIRDPWQKGPKYIPPSKGKPLNYTVEFITDDEYPICRELDSLNPYFTEIENLPGNKRINHYCYNTEPTRDYAKNLFYKMHHDYDGKNGNYIFSFTNIMRNKIYGILRIKDFKKAKLYCNNYLLINKFIKRSGTLIPYKGNKRKEISEFINSTIREFEVVEEFCKITSSTDFTKKFNEIINNFIELKNPQKLSKNKQTIVKFCIEHLDYLMDNNTIERVISQFMKIDYIAFFKSHLFFLLSLRRKQIRSKLLTGKYFKRYEDLQNNPEFEHLIYLQEIETKRLEYEKQIPEYILSKSSYFRFKAYYSSNIDEAIKYLQCSLDFLKPKVPEKCFKNNKEYLQWTKRKYIERALSLELLALITDHLDKKIDLLQSTFECYSFAHNAKSYLIEELINYYKIQKCFKEKKSITEINKITHHYYEKLEQNFKVSEGYFPLISSFSNLYKILFSYDDYSYNVMNFLYSIASLRKHQYNIIPNLQKLSKIILANNLINEISDDKIDLYSSIREFFLTSSINFNSIIGHLGSEDYGGIIFLDRAISVILDGQMETEISDIRRQR